jgi:hypothetical protein
MTVEQISRAVAIFRELPRSSDEEVFRKLVPTGVERQYAARLVEFLPMAYGRLLLGKAGMHFSDMFQRMTPSGDLTAEQPLSSEPGWEEVVSFAQAEARRVVSKEDVMAAAGRSAELHAANQLLNQGSKPEDLILTTALLKWPQEGPPL